MPLDTKTELARFHCNKPAGLYLGLAVGSRQWGTDDGVNLNSPLYGFTLLSCERLERLVIITVNPGGLKKNVKRNILGARGLGAFRAARAERV